MESFKKNTITDERVEDTIVKKEFITMGLKTTICCITLRNGFEVVGVSACVDPDNFDADLGRKYALKDAISKVEELEGYRLQSELFGGMR